MGVTDHPFNFTTSITPSGGAESQINKTNVQNGTLTIGDRKIEISFTDNENNNTAALIEGGYTLADGDTITITKLKDGDQVTFNETDGATAGYTVAYYDADLYVEGSEDNTIVKSPLTVDGDKNILVTNERNVGTPTGFFEDNLPFTLMISAAGLAGIALIATILVRRQRRRRE